MIAMTFLLVLNILLSVFNWMTINVGIETIVNKIDGKKYHGTEDDLK